VSADARHALGALGEELARAHLEGLGFAIVGMNVRVGRLEIDVIARRPGLVVFCEVRTRESAAFVDPIDTISFAKQQRIRAAARAYLARLGDYAGEVRFDAAQVVGRGRDAVLTYYESAF
jgi:putative endonuclease